MRRTAGGVTLARREIDLEALGFKPGHPAYLTIPRYVWTAGAEVGQVVAAAGLPPDPIQEISLNAVFAEQDDGTPVVFDYTAIGPRQNFKTGLGQQCSIGWLYVADARKIAYTAHEWNPAVKEMFTDLSGRINDTPSLAKRTRKIYEGNGEEEIVLRNGASMLFKTRTSAKSKSPTRGLAGLEKLIVDEGLKAQTAHMGGLLPPLATKRNRQVLYLSSGALADSTVLHQLIKDGRARTGGPRSGYLECCMPPPSIACDRGDDCDHSKRTPGCGLDKPEMLAIANPQYGGRIEPVFFVEMRGKMTPHEFGREFATWHDEPLEDEDLSPFDVAAWDDLEDDDPDNAPATMPMFGLEVEPNRTYASISAAGHREDGRSQLELVTRGRGTSWVVSEFEDLDEKHGPITVGVDATGPAKGMITSLQRAGINVVPMATKDLSDASAAIVEAVNQDGTIAHGPDDYLRDAVKGVRTRRQGDGGFVLAREASDVETGPLLAAAWALWLLGELDYDVADSVL